MSYRSLRDCSSLSRLPALTATICAGSGAGGVQGGCEWGRVGWPSKQGWPAVHKCPAPTVAPARLIATLPPLTLLGRHPSSVPSMKGASGTPTIGDATLTNVFGSTGVTRRKMT